MTWLMKDSTAALKAVPDVISRSSQSAAKPRESAIMALSAVMEPAADWLEPTARNSKRLPVKATGLVRLRSPGSVGRGGRVSTPTFMTRPLLPLAASPMRPARKASKTSVS